MTDLAQRRSVMVDTQVRPNDVTKYPIIAAMLDVPRELFVPEALRDVAYVGENVPLAPGRVLAEPRTLAKLLDALDPGPGDRVLVVGAGTGYAAAVLARMAGEVVALEEDAGLAGRARAALAAAGAQGVELVTGPLAAGWPARAPYDVILVDGGVEQVPEALTGQLARGGRIGAVFMEGALGAARVARGGEGRPAWRLAFNAALPVLPGFAAVREFVL
ncbi:MAG: protein-L-isoaspartate O-methyltransferase [Rhodobacteraceae bacterium]|nr:protein-L-isoaspartate O-methyltransferase [Paracoccaceae bacterium]